MQGGASCPEGHPLLLGGETGEFGWTCDLCGESKAKNEKPWKCEENKMWGRGGSCDYDVCSACMDKYKVGSKCNVVVPCIPGGL